MTDPASLTTDDVLALAARRGITLAREDAEALRPMLESVLRRLAALTDAVPPETAPLPGGGERFPA